MEQIIKEQMRRQINESVWSFKLPRYHEIPNVGLYLEQTTKYISDCLAPLSSSVSITGSMISNYVKRGLIVNPIKKQYSRDQIAYLIFIAVVKSILSMDDIKLLIMVQKRNYEPQRAYDYFCSEFENILEYIFGKKEAIDTVGVDHSDTKEMLRNTIITVSHKIYLDKLFAVLHMLDETGAKAE